MDPYYTYIICNLCAQQHTQRMKPQPQRSNRRSRNSKKGGWGGWSRTTFVGPAWNGQNGGNFFAPSRIGVPAAHPVPVSELTGPIEATPLSPPLSACALSKSVGGSTRKSRSRSKHGSSSRSRSKHSNSSRSKHSSRSRSKHSSSSRSKHSSSSRSRSKRGGFVFGGFPQDMKIGWDNLKIGAQNLYRGFMGNNQLTSASPWNQPALNAKMGHSMYKPTDMSKLIAAADKTVNAISR